MTGATPESPDTRSSEYAVRLQSLSGARWKQVLDVQRPYRWNLKRQGLGRTRPEDQPPDRGRQPQQARVDRGAAGTPGGHQARMR